MPLYKALVGNCLKLVYSSSHSCSRKMKSNWNRGMERLSYARRVKKLAYYSLTKQRLICICLLPTGKLRGDSSLRKGKGLFN